jgi:hypothetical protein
MLGDGFWWQWRPQRSRSREGQAEAGALHEAATDQTSDRCPCRCAAGRPQGFDGGGLFRNEACPSETGMPATKRFQRLDPGGQPAPADLSSPLQALCHRQIFQAAEEFLVAQRSRIPKRQLGRLRRNGRRSWPHVVKEVELSIRHGHSGAECWFSIRASAVRVNPGGNPQERKSKAGAAAGGSRGGANSRGRSPPPATS